MKSNSGKYLILSKHDAGVVLTCVNSAIDEALEWAESEAINPFAIPYYCSLIAVKIDIEEFLS